MSIRSRLYPTVGQASVMSEHCSHARFVYNLGLEQRSMWRKGRVARINLATQMRELAQARKATDWLAAGSSVVQQGALRDLDRAYTNFFAGRASYPRFRSKNDTRQGFVIRDLAVRRLNLRWAEVQVPKVGWVRFRLSRPWEQITATTSARVTFAHGRWHVSMTCPPPARTNPGTGAMVGIDRGVANTLATSDGVMAHAPTWTPGEQARYLHLARRLARQTKGSARRQATRDAMGVLHRRLTDRRTNWVEQTTTDLARRYDLIALEDLRTKNMTRRPKAVPDPDQPGQYLPNGARAKAGLNKAILASCWGAFATRLAHKTTVILVDPRNTSRACNQCGHTSSDNRDSQAVFACTRCGHTAHADTNAALNILGRALHTTTNPGTPGARTHPPQGDRVNHLTAA